MYSLKMVNDEDKKRAKGVTKRVVKKFLTFQKYVDTIHDMAVTRYYQQTFRTSNHKLYTIVNNKISLSPYDDKRYILDDGINSVPYGFIDV